jgi:2-phosphoglycerate kinase
MSQYHNIDKFNDLWTKGQLKQPISIVIGGAAGTGKSTLQSEIAKIIPNQTLISTGTIRAILRTVIKKSQLPELYEQTFSVWKLSDDSKAILAYVRQCEPIIASIIQIIHFCQTEMQHQSIEGSHIIPSKIILSDEHFVCTVCLKVSDPATHRQYLSGPTHQRDINDNDFKTVRNIQDYVLQDAERTGVKVLECNQYLLSNCLAWLDKQIEYRLAMTV